MMRTTLDIDDDVLQAAKELAKHKHTTAGRVISDLARKGFRAEVSPAQSSELNGFEILPSSGRVVSPQLVRTLLEEGES